MKVSVIIPTYNGRHKLPIILESLKEQQEKADEIIVVVDGSTDGSEELLEQMSHDISSLKVIVQQNKGRATVRNTGVLHAKGDILIFFDDDMRLMPDVIAKHKHFHATNPGCILVGRATLDPLVAEGDDFTRFRVEIERAWNKTFEDKLNEVSFRSYAFTTQNLSCSKFIFTQIGGFDERLKDSEDFDFSVRALLHKVPIFYDYKIVAWHDDLVKIDKYIKRQSEYIKSKQILAELKPDYKNIFPESFRYGIQNKTLPRFLHSIFVFNKIWSALLGNYLFLKLIPKSIRFKVYDLIITLTAARNLMMQNDMSIKVTWKAKFFNLFRRFLKVEPINAFLARLSFGSDERTFITRLLPPHYLYKKPSFRIINRYGINFRVDLSDLVDWHLYYGLSEDAHQQLYRLCKENSIVIDVGTNNGAVLLQLSKIVSQGFVYGFEPDPINYKRCIYNVGLNNVTNISVSNVALGKAEGRANISVVDMHNLGMNRISNSGSGIEVPVTTLDNYVLQNKIQRVDIIKIDTEGYEMSVIEGAQQVLKFWKPKVFIEVNDDNLKLNGNSAYELIKNLLRNGYTLKRADTGELIDEQYDFTNCHFDIIGV